MPTAIRIPHNVIAHGLGVRREAVQVLFQNMILTARSHRYGSGRNDSAQSRQLGHDLWDVASVLFNVVDIAPNDIHAVHNGIGHRHRDQFEHQTP